MNRPMFDVSYPSGCLLILAQPPRGVWNRAVRPADPKDGPLTIHFACTCDPQGRVHAKWRLYGQT